MNAHSYPLPRTADDPRFTFGLILDVAEVLTRHGYPPLGKEGKDYVRLQQALFGFCYGTSTPAPGSGRAVTAVQIEAAARAIAAYYRMPHIREDHELAEKVFYAAGFVPYDTTLPPATGHHGVTGEEC